MANPITITLSSGRMLWFEHFRGSVVDQTKRSETEISSETLVTHTLNGSFAQTVVTGEKIRTHAIWLRGADGMEREFEIPSHGFSARAGHEVTVGWGGSGEDRNGAYVLALNHTAKGTWTLPLTADVDRRLGEVFKLRVKRGGFYASVLLWTLITAAAVGMLAGILTSEWLKTGAVLFLAMLCGPAEILGYLIVAWRSTKGILRECASIEEAFHEVAQRLA